jgi:hypothetical protein
MIDKNDYPNQLSEQIKFYNSKVWLLHSGHISMEKQAWSYNRIRKAQAPCTSAYGFQSHRLR